MFTHLHLHTEYSLLDGLTRIPQLMDRLSEMGQEAVAMTDHGAMYGAIDFYREARSRGIKPIIGVEAYVAPGSRLTRETGDKQPFHLTLLARNKTGYSNLLKLVTSSHLEGYYYRPRMDRELLAEHGEGIIALSGCPSGELTRLILEGRIDEAKATASWYRDVFDAYYFEVQDHDLPDFREAKRVVVNLSKEMGIPLVATNDSHYLKREDHDPHDILLCIGTNATVQEEKRMRMSDPSYYVRSEAEMRESFLELPEAVDNTWKIAEMCDLELEFGRLHLPDPDVPPGVTAHEHLEALCWEGLRRRLPDVGEAGDERLRYELEVVRATGFTNYMHIVREIAMFARSQNMRIGVRGSAAASLILYCLGVTDIDPLRANLVFERFLNLERPEAPDVDFDLPDERRDEVLRFVANRYGSDRVAQIITFGTLGAKAAVRDVGRALGMSYADVDRVARLIPNALHMTLDRAMNETAEMRAAYDADSQVRNLIDNAKRLEGVARNASTHAAGVVISREPLVEHLPLARPTRGEGHAMPTTQYAMEQVAAIGLVKMDLLGLSNLTILERALELIQDRHGIKIDLEHLPEHDEKSFAMLALGDTFGVFQLESAGMRRAVIELKPTSVDDLAALVALYRPGPMQHIGTFCRAKHGEEDIRYPHPDLADILDQTYGVITYQDQVLKIAQKFAGYTLGQADIMRKAMGKKIAAMMQAERERFTSGALAKGYSQEDADKVFELIEPFAGYAFNKAHSYSYGTIAYQTAYLKANYPVEYLTAVLKQAPSHPAGTLDRIAQAFNECVRLGITLLPPDINKSGVNFTIEELPAAATDLPSVHPEPVEGRGGGDGVANVPPSQAAGFMPQSSPATGAPSAHPEALEGPEPGVPPLLPGEGRGEVGSAPTPLEALPTASASDLTSAHPELVEGRGGGEEGRPSAQVAGLPPARYAIRFGLSMIKNVGQGAAESILESRLASEGAFTSLDDFCRNLNTRNLNKRALESLVKAGALDSIAGKPEARGSLLVNLDRILSIAQSSQKLRETGQTTMFDLFGAEVATPLSGIDLESAPIPKGEILAWEKELLGIWLSEHPFTHAAPYIAPLITALCSEITIENLSDLPTQGRDFIIGGMVGSTRRLTTRDGRGFIAAELEDLSGTLEVTVWPDVYDRTPELWLPGSIVLCQLRVRERGDRLSAGVNEAVPFVDDFLPPAWVVERPTEAYTPRNGNGNGHATSTPIHPEALEGPAPVAATFKSPDAAVFADREPPPPDPLRNSEPDPPNPLWMDEPIDTEEDTLYPHPEPVEGRALDPESQPIDPTLLIEERPIVPTGPLQLVLQESADEGDDQRRLAAVFRLLQAQPGPDPVRLTIRTRAGEAIDLALPPAHLDNPLRERLTQALEEQIMRTNA